MSGPLNHDSLSDELFHHRIAAALRELELPESDADIAAALDAVTPEPLNEAATRRIMQRVRQTILAARSDQQGHGTGRVASHPALPAPIPARPASAPMQACSVAACLALLTVIGLVFLQFSDIPHRPLAGRPRHDLRPAGVNTSLAVAPPVAPTVAPRVEHARLGETLRTGPREKRRLTLPDGSILSINEQSQVTISARRRIKLLAGELFVEVVPARSAGDRFVVETPHRAVTALGTKFDVKAVGRATNVVVTQGQVQVSGVDGVIPAGHELTTDLDEPNSAVLRPARRSAHVVEWVKDLMAAAGSVVVPASEHAGGTITVVDPQGQQMKLSLRKFHVDVHIEDGFARTTIDQTYFNHTWQQLEGTFRFPLPADASLSRLAMYVNGTLMEGGMVERDHGRNVFEQIRHTRRDPALLEWVDGSTFQMRVFPLEPRQEKRILLSYTQRLPADYGRSVYRFPSGHNLDGVREWSTLVRVKGAAGTKWYSPSHLLNGRGEHGDLVIEGRDEYAELDRDLVIELGDESRDVAIKAAPAWSVCEQDGIQYVMLRQRPELKATAKRAQRQWVFLFENSADRSTVLAETQRQIMKVLLENVEHDDRFSIIRAGTRAETFRPEPVPCSLENIAAAGQFLRDVAPLGALDMEQALQAVRQQARDDREVWIVHLGTGVAVLGERDETTLLRMIPSRARYVGVAVGKRWSKSFMETAACHNGGHVTQINPDEAVAWRAFDLLSTLNAPRLTEIAVQPADAATTADASRPADTGETTRFLLLTRSLAHGQELAAVTRIAKGQGLPRSMAITGKLNGQPYSQTVTLPDSLIAPHAAEERLVPRLVRLVRGPDGNHAGYLPRTWARLEIDRLVALGAAEHKARIIELSKSMYVMSPFTSLLVLETEAMYAQFNVDRGRKDHWALYPAPAQVPVVADAGPARLAPLEAAQERLKQAQARATTARSNYERSVADRRPTEDLQRLDRRSRAEQAEVQLIESEIKRIEAARDAASDPALRAWQSVILRRSTWERHYQQLLESQWTWRSSNEWMDLNGNGLDIPDHYWWSKNFFDVSDFDPAFQGRHGLNPVELKYLNDFGINGRRELQLLGINSSASSTLQGLNHAFLTTQFLMGNDLMYSSSGPMSPVRLQVRYDTAASERSSLPGLLMGSSPAINLNDDSLVQLQNGAITFEGLDRRKLREIDGYFFGSRMMIDSPEWTRLFNKRRDINGREYTDLSALETKLRVHSNHVTHFDAIHPWIDIASSDFGRQVPLEIDGELFSLVTGVDRDRWRGFRNVAAAYVHPLAGVLKDLPGYAPGLQTWHADRLAVVEQATTRPGSGDVDAAARQLIEKARSLGFEQIRIASADNSAQARRNQVIVADGRGRFHLTRELEFGLQETVISDGTNLWHLYPEIGLGAKRSLSRFHQSTIQSLIPWYVPSADDLSVNADVKLVGPRTVRITSLKRETPAPMNIPGPTTVESARPRPIAVELDFADTGRLAELRVIDLTAGKRLARQTITNEGTVRLFDSHNKVVATVQFELQSAEAPNLVPVTEGLVVLPLPYRSLAGIPVSVPVNLQTNAPDYAKLSDEESLMLLATYFAEARQTELVSFVEQRYTSRGDHRIGLVVLLASVVPQSPLVTQATSRHPGVPLAAYLQQFAGWVVAGSLDGSLDAGAKASPFLRRLCHACNYTARWTADRAAARERPIAELQSELAATMEFIRDCRSLELAAKLLSIVNSALKRTERMNAEFARTLDATAAAVATEYGVPTFGQTARIEWLMTAGDDESVARAQELFRLQLADSLDHGETPLLVTGIRNAFVKHFRTTKDQPCAPWGDVVRQAVDRLAGNQQPLVLIGMARRCIVLEEPALAAEIFALAIKGRDLGADMRLNLAALQFAREAGQWEQAEECVRRVLADEKLRQVPDVWRDAAEIANHLRKFAEWIEFLDRASELEFAALPKTVNLDLFRQSCDKLFGQFEQRADQLADAAPAEKQSFVQIVRRSAERWREIDVDDTAACHRTAKILTKLGLAPSAWDYWTTPLAETPDQSTVWMSFASAMNSEQRFTVADRAWSTAFECEPTNPEILLQHAQFLKATGQLQRAHELLTRITTNTWQPRFDNVKNQAQTMLTTR